MHRHLTYYRLKEALSKQGCPVCHLAEDAVDKFFDALFYEYINDAHIHKEITHSGGFCKTHAHRLLKFADNLGASIIFSRLARVYNKSLEMGTMPNDICPACRRFEEASIRYCKAFAEYISDEEFRKIYKNSSGLCMEHLRDVLLLTRDKNKEWLSSVEQEKLKKLMEQMEQFIEASDYRFEDDERRNKYSRIWEITALKLTSPYRHFSHRPSRRIFAVPVFLSVLGFLALLFAFRILLHSHG